MVSLTALINGLVMQLIATIKPLLLLSHIGLGDKLRTRLQPVYESTTNDEQTQ